MERPTPDAEIKNFHHDKGHSNVYKEHLDRNILPPQPRQAQIHDQEAGFRAPDSHDLAILHHKNELAAERSLVDVLLRHMRNVVAGREEIRRCVFDNVYCGDDDRVGAQGKHHEVIIGLESTEGAKSHAARNAAIGV